MAALGPALTCYVYSPLLPRHTRLLKYTAAAPEAPQVLNLAIVTCALHDFCRPYIALSYTWDAPITVDDESVGLESETSEVLIESVTGAPSTIEIRQNLYDALQTLGPAMLRKKRDDGVSHIWIDAICINQDDAEERSQQVALMGKIYSSALSVWAWLGAADETTTAVAWLHTEVWAAMDESTKSDPWAEENMSISNEGVRFPKRDILVNRIQIQSLFRFYSRRRLLNRLWVVQELVLGHDVLLWIDTHPVSMAGFEFWLSLVTEIMPFNFFKLHAGAIGNELKDATQNLRAFRVTTELATQHRAGGPSDPARRILLQEAYGAGLSEAKTCVAYLIYLLAITGNHDSKDPRDKLCGILGMVQPFWPSSGTLLIEPSYATPVEQVYYELATWCMYIHSSLCVLSLVVRNPGATASELPSWVPNLAARGTDAPEDLQRFSIAKKGSGGYEAFHANGPIRSRKPCFRVDGMSLFARGHMLATIESLSVSLPVLEVLKIPADDTADDILCELQLLEFMMLCCTSNSPYTHGGYFGGQEIIAAVVGCTQLGVDYNEDGGRVAFLAHMMCLLSKFYMRARPEELALAIRHRCMVMLEERTDIFGTEVLKQMRDIDTKDAVKRSEHSDTDTVQVVFQTNLDDNMASRRMFQTNTRLFGLAHVSALPDDEVWILSDAKVPFLLRPLSDESGRYSLVGEAYVHGAMYGEFVDEDDQEMLWETVEIV
ncbi:hypothetical protein B0A48_16715 [Cryoendolithus antarcticus]|uniref:Heterokaryon incompatibility domain-containing protein n=1 Tax=Cryoendolithus antarcticus TaxID=1507870 RepID=A0A1V8SFE7_9PEZI|nr:hypothetical protein B0A48_16715 [Cryoendolithus antarcticus]